MHRYAPEGNTWNFCGGYFWGHRKEMFAFY